MISPFRSLCFLVAASSLVSANLCADSPKWNAMVSPAGSVELTCEGKFMGALVPGLHEATWRAASMTARSRQPASNGVHVGEIVAPGGAVVDVELRLTAEGDATRFVYRMTPRTSLVLNGLHVSLELPTADWAGGEFSADDRTESLPRSFDNISLRSGPTKSLRISAADGPSLHIEHRAATPTLVQDNRQWGPSFSIRIGPQMGDGETWPAGKSLTLDFDLSAEGGLAVEEDGPVTIQAGPDWLPLDVALDIEPGSALDFSDVIPRDLPAGKHGRLIVNSEGKFAFADQPGNPVRFYGVNLCFSAHYLDHAVADQLAQRLYQLGYNSLRVHHYERELVEESSDQTIRLHPEKLDQLDYLMAALKKRGIYVSTDLFVSRPVSKSLIYPGHQGDIGMDEYKMAVHVNERAFADFKAFSRLLLDHVNPYTKLRYAEDPTLAWISLVNEDNPGNFIGRLEGPLRDDWQRAWNDWLVSRFKDRQTLVDAMGGLPDDLDPVKGNVPLQNVHADSPASMWFNVFLAEIEQDFFDRTRRFLRDDLRCDALLTDINSWTNPVQLQAVRGSFDYVDDHFYVDHPKFLERPWSLPSSCPNTSPIADGAPGGRNCAFTRLYGKPFTITEFNYSSPGRFRGVGGILTGTLGALQDWDGVWRFAYAHNRDNVISPGALNYFDVSADPLNQAAERASLCLFLRGDIQPANHSISITATKDQLLRSPTTSRDKTPSWHGLAWLSRVGWTLVDEASTRSGDQVWLPIVGGKIDPFASQADEKILAGMRKAGWLQSDNRTNLAKNLFQSDTGEVTIDAPQNVLILDTARTAGGFAPRGKTIETRSVTIEVQDTDATVWVSSLDQKSIVDSKRLLITHLTDLQNTKARYGDRRRTVLLDWGQLPHLVQAGRAEVTLRLADASTAKVYGLSTSGKRIGLIDVTRRAGELLIPLSVSNDGKARMLYEVQLSP